MKRAELVAKARGMAQVQEHRSPLRTLLHELADELEGKVEAPTPSSGMTFEDHENFSMSRNVKYMPWQRARLKGPVTMRLEGEEWVEL